MLQCSNISKSYKNIEILRNISLQIKTGEFVSLIGPSGCGKSTLLTILAGIDHEVTGEIFFSGRKVSDRRGMTGFMPQKPLLLPWRNVLENVVLGSEIKAISQKEAEKKAKTLLKIFGLKDFLYASPSALSGGMSQKVALLRTVFFNNKILLLDEPFGALDALTRMQLQFWLLELWQKYRSTMLFVTHDIREAILLSDRIFVMSDRPGQIVADILVDLPRPRSSEQLTTKKALTLERHMLALLTQ